MTVLISVWAFLSERRLRSLRERHARAADRLDRTVREVTR